MTRHKWLGYWVAFAVASATAPSCKNNDTGPGGAGGHAGLGGSPGSGGAGTGGTGGSTGSAGSGTGGETAGLGGGMGGAGGTVAAGSGGGAGHGIGGMGGHAAGGSGGSGGSAAGTGGAATGSGGAAEAGVCPGNPAPNPDVSKSCTAAHAVAGAACTQDCCLPCGIDSVGTATCRCTATKYSACECPRPATWTAIGGECGDSRCMTSGGPCSPQGYASAADAPSGGNVLDGQPCVMNGNACFTAETDGKHGCVCASDPSGDFIMRCGLVNGWFTNDGQTTTY